MLCCLFSCPPSFIPMPFFHPRPPQDPYFFFECLIVSETAAIYWFLVIFGVFGYENHTQVSNGRPGRLVCFALKTGTHSARHTHACLHTAPHTLGHLRNPSLQPPTGRRSTCSVQDLRLWSSSPFASNRHPASPTTALQIHVVPRPTASLDLNRCTTRPS